MRLPLKRFKAIAKEHNVKIVFHKAPKDYGGYYFGDKKRICVVLNSYSFTISAFFHELSHVLEHRDGIYINYYEKFNRNKVVLRKLALRAERHTDKRAQKLCKVYFPKVKYCHGYRGKGIAKWLKEWYS